MPVQMVRDPLDIELPSLFPTRDADSSHSSCIASAVTIQHPKGPYLDQALQKQLSVGDFERLAMQHFLVFDSKGLQHNK